MLLLFIRKAEIIDFWLLITQSTFYAVCSAIPKEFLLYFSPAHKISESVIALGKKRHAPNERHIKNRKKKYSLYSKTSIRMYIPTCEDGAPAVAGIEILAQSQCCHKQVA